jgi:hypothetical protein
MFRSDDDYDYFASLILNRARYVLDDWQQSFIYTVLETSKKRTAVIEAGEVLWRAALGGIPEEGVCQHDVFYLESLSPHTLERMKPLRDRAQEGRVNPKGIPCLYMATTPEVAMMETRPWAGSALTLSQLILMKTVTIVDCSLPASFELQDKPTPEQRESNNWHVINNAFSEPVSRTDDVADYAPTQYLAEVFRKAGYDGIVYTSHLGEGKNVALFDVNVAEVASRQLRAVKKLSFSFRELNQPEYVEKHKDKLTNCEETVQVPKAEPTD